MCELQTETPASIGVSFERTAIHSGSRHLDGYLVIATACHDAPILLVYHGVQETISQWLSGRMNSNA
jgi:hypothetical protein